MLGNLIKRVFFETGTKSQYEEMDHHEENTTYWLEDTQQLYRGDVLYGTGAAATSESSGLMSAEDKSNLDYLVEGATSSIQPADTSIDINDEHDVKYIKVNISENEGNIIELMNGGLYSTVPESTTQGYLKFGSINGNVLTAIYTDENGDEQSVNLTLYQEE